MNKYKYDVYKHDEKIASDITSQEISEIIGIKAENVRTYACSGTKYKHTYKIVRHNEEPGTCKPKQIYKYDVYKYDKKFISGVSSKEVSEIIGMDVRNVCQYAYNGYLYDRMYKIAKHNEEPSTCKPKQTHKYDVYKHEEKIISDVSPEEISEMIGMDAKKVSQYACNGYLYKRMYQIARHGEEPGICKQKEKMDILREWDSVCMKLRHGRPRT